AEKEEDAILLLNQIFEGDTNFVRGRISAARMAYQTKKYEEAKSYLLNANRFSTVQKNEIYNLLALSYHQLEMPDSADYYLSEGKRLFVIDPLFYANQGYVDYYRGNFASAEQASIQAIKMN